MIKPGTIFTGDNLPILRGMDSVCVDLIYLDPPFNSKRDYAAPIGSRAAGAEFKDTWTLNDTDDAWWGEIADEHPALYKVIDAAGAAGGNSDKAYCIYMAMRILEMRRVLKPSGSIYYHCDPTMSHSVKLLMDAIFGARQFRNEIIWRKYSGRKNNAKRKFSTQHDVLLFYAASTGAHFNGVMIPHSPQEIAKKYRYVDDDGRRYRLAWGRAYQQKREQKKLYLDDSPGRAVGTLWVESGMQLNTSSKESTKYPTQKPLALLKRIITASSAEGEIVLDPFCGCATACVAAQYEGRKWIGIDISPKAYDLTRVRFEKELGIFNPDIIHRDDIPVRTDQEERSKNIKHVLFGRQRGVCNGCRYDFQFQNFTIDHIVPRALGGSDSDENLQLLCNYCNSRKGTRKMEELIAGLERDGMHKPPPGEKPKRKRR